MIPKEAAGLARALVEAASGRDLCRCAVEVASLLGTADAYEVEAAVLVLARVVAQEPPCRDRIVTLAQIGQRP